MDQDLYQDISRRLEHDFEFKRKGSGKWLQGGLCPSCKHKEAFTSKESPWMIKCGRLNQCGAEFHVKELYPDAFNSWSDRFKPTAENPNASADAYLRESRGFPLDRIKGWYTQENYVDYDTKESSATVRFELPGIGYWERIIDRPERFGKRKATFKGEYAGKVWAIPGFDYTQVKEIYIVEGIFDAISLWLNGYAAVSAMSCNNNCWVFLKQLAEACNAANLEHPSIVWAFDNGVAGTQYIKKYARESQDRGWICYAAQLQDKLGKQLDWNDQHARGRLNEDTIKEARYNGALLLARHANDKALLIYNHTERRMFWFIHENRMYWCEIDLDKYSKARDKLLDRMGEQAEQQSEEEVRQLALVESRSVFEIANCHFTALYFQADHLTGDSWYYLRVDFPHDGESIKSTFAGSQLTKAATFKDRLISIAPGAIFSGKSFHLDQIIEDQLYKIKTVQTINFQGYSVDHGAYVFNDVAVKDGRVFKLNDEDFFDIGKISIKSLLRVMDFEINTKLDEFKTSWVETIWQCYGAKGIVVLAYWLGSMFAEQIRREHKSFPFLEFIGEPGSGKSTLIEFLWRLVGREGYEGFDPSKSSPAARARNFSQVANLPVVLIEGDRSKDDKNHSKQFDFNELKPLYDGRSIYSRGIKNNGNETYEPPFRGSLIISQNAEVSAEPAVMQRIVHIKNTTQGHTPQTKKLADSLKRLKTSELSGFSVKAMKAESAIMQRFQNQFAVYEPQLQQIPDIKSLRIVANHAQIMAMVDCLSLVIPISEDKLEMTRDELADMAVARQQASNEDHPVVQTFWETFEYLNGDDEDPKLNHHSDKTLIAVSLNHYIQIAADRRQQVPALDELKKHLRTSRRYQFVDSSVAVHSYINATYNKERDLNHSARPETVRCWVFRKPS